MSKYTATKLSAEQRLRRDQVMRMWASHQGWPDGGWPTDRRHDAIQIQHWTQLLALPMDFWVGVVGRVPKGRAFRWLTTPPGPDRVSLLQQLSVEYLQARHLEQTRQAEATAEALGSYDPAAGARADEMIRTLATRMRMRVA